MRLGVGDWLFDSDSREVVRRGRTVPLSPKAFALLELLIRRRPRAVSKAEIHEHLWPGTFVSPANLANLVVELRAALGDDARKPKILRTVTRFGYAFCAEGSTALDSPAASRRFTCRLVWGPRDIPLDSAENVIGRDSTSVVWIDDVSVSRRHARIAIDDAGATIEDLGSKNGTYVRGRRIQQPTRLEDRDPIRIGPASIVFRMFQKSGTTASTIEEQEPA